jgi:hypothetical protein
MPEPFATDIYRKSRLSATSGRTLSIPKLTATFAWLSQPTL